MAAATAEELEGLHCRADGLAKVSGLSTEDNEFRGGKRSIGRTILMSLQSTARCGIGPLTELRTCVAAVKCALAQVACSCILCL